MIPEKKKIQLAKLLFSPPEFVDNIRIFYRYYFILTSRQTVRRSSYRSEKTYYFLWV